MIVTKADLENLADTPGVKKVVFSEDEFEKVKQILAAQTEPEDSPHDPPQVLFGENEKIIFRQTEFTSQ